MLIKLNKRWGSYLPRAEVSVSVERARYLCEELKVAKPLEPWPDAKGKAANESDQQGDQNPPPSLVGTDKLPPDVVLVGSVQVGLGEIVARAHKDSEEAVEAWNTMDAEARDLLILAAVEDMRNEAIDKMTGTVLDALAAEIKFEEYDKSAKVDDKKAAIKKFVADSNKE